MDRRRTLAVLATLCLLVAPAAPVLAWTDLTVLHAGGKAKEVPVHKAIERVMIVCLDQPMIVNTIVVREGGRKTPYRVGKRFSPQERFVLPLGMRRMVTGLRISDDLHGNYLVRVE